MLEAAIRAKKVDRAFITRLSVCLAADSLLETIGFTHYYLSIRHISLKGCTLLTDNSSAGLKRFCADPRVSRLEVLNLTGCNSITSPHTLRDVSPLTKISLHTSSLQACAIERGE
ncbi:hypothetical protein HDU98_005975 [Podochytrium sp. JEL0797]|nr:hypothetical protein HDU98_005975 [Podochytrium sp. JEL0797]